ncbi:hypothetical protein [Cryobacterium sp. Y62]|nr:hypothetical protein [Cryobacterium sp. Y62]
MVVALGGGRIGGALGSDRNVTAGQENMVSDCTLSPSGSSAARMAGM